MVGTSCEIPRGTPIAPPRVVGVKPSWDLLFFHATVSRGLPPQIQAVLSRAELLLSSECSAQPALDAAVSAMEGAVDAWSRVEAEEAEKRRKDAEIIKYKMQEHVVRFRV